MRTTRAKYSARRFLSRDASAASRRKQLKADCPRQPQQMVRLCRILCLNVSTRRSRYESQQDIQPCAVGGARIRAARLNRCQGDSFVHHSRGSQGCFVSSDPCGDTDGCAMQRSLGFQSQGPWHKAAISRRADKICHANFSIYYLLQFGGSRSKQRWLDISPTTFLYGEAIDLLASKSLTSFSSVWKDL